MSNLVRIQSSEKFVTILKMLAAKRNQKLYELVEEAMTHWLSQNTDELSAIADFCADIERVKSSKLG